MSYKFDSLMLILNKLDGKETVTVYSLMNDLEVSERSVHRYLLTLQVAGFPVLYDRKKESYVFQEGFSLTRPHLSLEENLAFALAKNSLKSFGAGMVESLGKIENKLSIKKDDIPKHIVLNGDAPSPAVEQCLGAIHQALINFQRIELVYKALYSNKQTKRKIDPYYLFYQDGFWHLRGYCHLRKDLRIFALDRILSMKALNEHFLPSKISPVEEVAESFGAWVGGKPGKVVLRFDAQCKPYILRKKWHKSQQETELKDGRLEVTFEVNGVEGMKEWIYRWLPHVEVISPKRLREMIKADLQKAVNVFQ